jgi:hypothetical protein
LDKKTLNYIFFDFFRALFFLALLVIYAFVLLQLYVYFPNFYFGIFLIIIAVILLYIWVRLYKLIWKKKKFMNYSRE